MLDRAPATLREWERSEVLPQDLRPSRSSRGWRTWTPEQIEGIRQWMQTAGRTPGRGIREALASRGIEIDPPSAEEQERILEGQRRPRKHVREELVA